MPNGSMRAALVEAQRMAWDETIGYTFGGDGNPDSNGYDCSAFVIRCLYRAGFSVPAHRVGTGVMGQQVLVPAGFTELQYTAGMPMQNGDIVVINDGSYGHTYYYAEDVYGYSDYPQGSAPDYASNVTRTFAQLPYAKIEAYSSLGRTQSGDNPNSHGACCEVWVHRLNPAHITGSHPASSCKVYRCPWNDIGQSDFPWHLFFGNSALLRRRRREDA